MRDISFFSESFVLQGQKTNDGGLSFILTRDKVLKCNLDLPGFGDYWLGVEYAYVPGLTSGGPYALVCESTSTYKHITNDPGILKVFMPAADGLVTTKPGRERLRKIENGLRHTVDVYLGDLSTGKEHPLPASFDFEKCRLGVTVLRTQHLRRGR